MLEGLDAHNEVRRREHDAVPGHGTLIKRDDIRPLSAT